MKHFLCTNYVFCVYTTHTHTPTYTQQQYLVQQWHGGRPGTNGDGGARVMPKLFFELVGYFNK